MVLLVMYKRQSLSGKSRPHLGFIRMINKDVNRLGNRAIYGVLSQRAQHYRKLLPLIHFELSRARYKEYKGRFRGLVKEGEAGLSPGIKF